MCYSQECLNIRSHYSDPTKFKCEHLQACKESFQQATLVEIELTNITKYVRSELLLCELKEKENNGKFSVHVLPDKNVVLSLLQKRSHQCPSGLIHIDLAKFKCPVKKCDNLPKGHYLVKSKQMCIHVLICKLIISENERIQVKQTQVGTPSHQFCKKKTVENVIDKIINSVPSPLDREAETEFLQESFKIQRSLFESKSLKNFERRFCDKCETPNILRNKRPGNLSYLVTPGYMIEIVINTFVCKKCEILNYPDMIKAGFVPISDSLIVSWSYIVNGRSQVQNGSKLYKFFRSSLRHLSLENPKLAEKINLIDFHNMSIRLAKCTLAFNSACLIKSSITEDVLSIVLCLHCGIIPTILMSDGNAKNSIFLREGSII